MRELNRDGEWEDGDPPRRPRPTKSVADLFAIARYQKVILFCVLIHLVVAGISVVASPSRAVVPLAGQIAAGVFALALITTEVVFVFLLATRVFGTGPGIALAVFTAVPCVGLILLLVINGKASTILKEHDVRVGLLGAWRSDLLEYQMDQEGRARGRSRRDDDDFDD